MKISRTEQEAFDQDRWNMQQLLSLDPDRIYKIEDLEDEKVLGRSLRLLYLAKFGREALYTRISPHLKYDKLPISLSKGIEGRLELDEHQIRESLAVTLS